MDDNQRHAKTINEIKTYVNFIELANGRRGVVLDACINIERLIDEFLAYYFCQKDEHKRKELLGLILVNGKLGLRAKMTTFKIVTTELYPKEQDYLKELFAKIEVAISVRNTMAHRTINESNFLQDFKEKKTVYKEYYGNGEPYELTDDTFIELTTTILDAVAGVSRVLSWISTQINNPSIVAI